jgi:hypothetical protein
MFGYRDAAHEIWSLWAFQPMTQNDWRHSINRFSAPCLHQEAINQQRVGIGEMP